MSQLTIPATCHKSDIPHFAMWKGGTNSKPYSIGDTTYSAGTLRFEKQCLSADVVNYTPKEQVYSGVYLFTPVGEPAALSFDFAELPSYTKTENVNDGRE